MKRMFCGGWLAVIALIPLPAHGGPWAPEAAVADSGLAVFGVCYATLGNSGPNAGSLIRIDLATGAGTVIGPTGITGGMGDKGVPALAIRANGEMYAADIGDPSNLYRLDAKSGAATLIGATGLVDPPALVFGGGDILYAAEADGNLYTLDPLTAAATLVGTSGAAIRGLAVDPLSGDLWASDASSRIYKVDNLTAVATLVGNTGRAPSPDLSFDPAGTLFAVSGGGLSTNNLLSINLSTGAGTVIGPIGFTSVSGMAMRIDHIVPTLVQTYRARWQGSGIELRWRLAGNLGSVSFVIDRAAGAGGYERLDGAGVSWDGTEYVYLDATAESGRAYRYRVTVLEDGEPVTSFETSLTARAPDIALEPNHPNPFGATTRIQYAVPRAARVTLTVHDVAGRLVRVLVDRRVEAGSHGETWDGRDSRGARVDGGAYFLRLRLEDHVLTRTMMLLD